MNKAIKQFFWTWAYLLAGVIGCFVGGYFVHKNVDAINQGIENASVWIDSYTYGCGTVGLGILVLTASFAFAHTIIYPEENP